MSKDKQIDEIAKLICNFPQCINYNSIGECKPTECQIADKAEALYNAGYRKQEWISVDERLPTKEDANVYGDVLAITCKDRRVRSWSWDWLKSYPKLFTHWMPLPEAPKMKGGE